MKKLPLGDQTFSEIIDQNLLYADKTKYIFDLIKSTKRNYFLSRPRRFGKTMLLSTMEELFTGGVGRFQGLWIEKSGYEFPSHPVIHLTLTTSSESPEILKSGLLSKLREFDHGGYLKDGDGVAYDIYFGKLIKALYKYKQKKVVVLIDEYDAPVTRNMENFEVAKDNVKSLQTFFSTLKQTNVKEYIHFTFVTGITRYGLTSMDSGPNHLNDISLDPRYAGICGFTTEEFDLLFAERMEDTLINLKKDGNIESSASVEDLKRKIFDWYDGYNWGGKTRVLNPYSMLHFFDENFFRNYWIRSGRPGHLTALIKSRPLDFIEPKLVSYVGETLRRAELDMLQPIPVLFHSGYLTVDKVTSVSVINENTQLYESTESYTFRLPNFEVSSSYINDCFSVLFGVELYQDEVKLKSAELLEAFLAKDAGKVSSVFDYFLSKVTYHQRPENEKTFHALVHMLLLCLGFKVLSEVPGADNRLDLFCILPEKVCLIIELKYCSVRTKLNDAAIAALAKKALVRLPKSVTNMALADAVAKKIKSAEYRELLNKISTDFAGQDTDEIIADKATEYLSDLEYDETLALAIEPTLSEDETEEIIMKAAPDSKRTPSSVKEEEIMTTLAHAAQRALDDITARNYHTIVDHLGKSFIYLGMAAYKDSRRIKAIFG